MSHLDFPLLYWKFNSNTLIGYILGIDQGFFGKNTKDLKDSIKSFLKGSYDEGWDYRPEIKNAQLKVFNVSVNSSYVTQTGYYPIMQQVNVPITAVYGENEEYGYAKCFLPFLDRSFYYYDKKQLKTLLEHYAKDVLNGQEPAHMHRYLQSRDVALDTLRFKYLAKPAVDQHIFNPALIQDIKQFADPLPVARSIRRKAFVFPETAWERGNQVDRIADILINSSMHVLVVGEPGVGKSVILMEAIRKASRNMGSFKKREATTFWPLNHDPHLFMKID